MDGLKCPRCHYEQIRRDIQGITLPVICYHGLTKAKTEAAPETKKRGRPKKHG